MTLLLVEVITGASWNIMQTAPSNKVDFFL